MSHYPDCPCPSIGSGIEHNRVVPYIPSAPSPPQNVHHSTSGNSVAGFLPPVYQHVPSHQQSESTINGSQIAGIVSAICSMIIMIVMVVISFLKKYVYGSSGRGNSSSGTNTHGVQKGTGSVKSGDSLENNLMLMEEAVTSVFPNGKSSLTRSNTFIVREWGSTGTRVQQVHRRLYFERDFM